MRNNEKLKAVHRGAFISSDASGGRTPEDVDGQSPAKIRNAL
jgi:hypothetical protein